MTPVLRLDDVVVEYKPGVRALDRAGVSLSPGEIVGLVGESGSGKSTLAAVALGLLPESARLLSGGMTFQGVRLDPRDRRALEPLRGAKIAYVPQEPMTALNPTLKVGRQIDLILSRHLALDRHERERMATTSLRGMGIREPARVLGSYPFQLSGGQIQRVLLAIALSLRPALLIADEPTTALDATVQAEVLALIAAAARERDVGVLLITHNIGLVWQTCDVMVVMRRGRTVEAGPTRGVISAPKEAYTRQLLAALPSLSAPRQRLPVAAGVD